MRITKKDMKALGLTDEQIELLYEAHEEGINGLREERDKLKADLSTANAEVTRLANVEKDLVKANAKLEDAEETAEKLKKLKGEFDAYKADVDAKAVAASKAELYKELLTKAGIPEKRQAAILKVTDLETIEVKDGKIENADKVSESIKAEWADFIVTESKQGADVKNPPDNNGGSSFEKMSLADKMSYANDNPDSAEVKAWLGK